MAIQRNVQQQNDLAFQQMLRTAQRVRREGVPTGVQAFLHEQGIDAQTCAFVHFEMEAFMLGVEQGVQALLVTPSFQFFEFEVELDSARTRVTVVHAFENVTQRQDLAVQKRGTRMGYGALAVSVLRALNSE